MSTMTAKSSGGKAKIPLAFNDSPQAPRTKAWQRFLRVFLGRKVVSFGAVIIAILILVALTADWITPYDPYQQNLREALKQPSSAHLLGTDALGRDTLSRIIYGTRTSLAVGINSVGLAALIGMALGLAAGYLGGWVSTLIMRCVDALMAIPPLMLALSIGVALGGGLTNVIISLGISLIPTYVRLMRGQVLAVKQSDYVKANEVAGASDLRTMMVHVFPNCLSPLIVLITLNLGVAIIAEAGLSFVGLGITPPGAAWGSMVNDGYRYLLTNPVLSFAPGFCVMLVVLAFNLVGDGLRDALDPRLRGTL
ncbi:Glutathione transport system permease protein GsiD [Anaerolineales bacterium]|nr:Glutathione transport system permease protein GsiD [Anaerolineales bacterium]